MKKDFLKVELLERAEALSCGSFWGGVAIGVGVGVGIAILT